MMLAIQAFLTPARPEFVRFLLVGVLNTLFGYAVFVTGLAVALRPEPALAVATLVGALFNYLTTARLVFQHNAENRLLQFVVAYAVIYLINTLAIKFLLQLGVPPQIAQAALAPPIALVSFLLFRNFVFRPAGKQ